jgi:hypothetical protein
VDDFLFQCHGIINLQPFQLFKLWHNSDSMGKLTEILAATNSMKTCF